MSVRPSVALDGCMYTGYGRGMTITHDLNGPFVRAAHAHTSEVQTETVWAIEVTSATGTEYWNATNTESTDDDLALALKAARRMNLGDHTISARIVRRDVSISATEWVEVDA